MAVTQPGDVTVIAPIAVQNDANYAMRAESILGGFVALASGSGPPTAAKIPLIVRRVGTLAYTPTDGKWWQLVGGTADANWVERSMVAAVLSVFGRVGAVVAAAGDYTSSQITNASAVTGATVTAALNTLNSALATAGPVSSVFGRTGAVVAVLNDYTSSLIQNLATVTGGGSTVTSALNALQAQISAAVTGVSSWNSRTGAVVPASGDYAASQVANDSTVTGTGVAAALNTLKTSITALVTGVSSVYGRAGAVVATTGDYTSTQITNSSGVTGTGVTGALNTLNSAITSATLTADETSAHIASQVISVKNGGITDTKVATTAAIAGTKISPDFGAQNVVTTGYIQAPQIGDGTGNIEVHATSFQTTCIGNFIGLGQSFAGLNNGDSTASGSLPSLTISASSGSGSATHTAGLLILSGGSTTSPSGTGGDLFLSGGSGPSNTKNGNIALNLFPVSWQSMEHGVYIAEASATPTGNPTSGFFLYVDPVDHELKVRGPSGTAVLAPSSPLWVPTSVKTSAYNAQPGEFVKYSVAGGGFTITLPDPTTFLAGASVKIKNTTSSANSLTVQSAGGATIDGFSSFIQNHANMCAEYTSDGANWWATTAYRE